MKILLLAACFAGLAFYLYIGLAMLMDWRYYKRRQAELAKLPWGDHARIALRGEWW